MSNETTNTTAAVAAKPNTMQLAVPEATIAALDAAAASGVLAQSVTSQFKKMFLLGAAMQQLRALLTPEVMRPIMELQNSPIGFCTDRPGGYGEDIVRDCVIEAAMNGVSVCGNEFNILVGRCYVTKNGMKHKLRDIAGLYTSFTPGIPRNVGEAGAVVRMHIEWTIGSKSNTRDIDFAIRVNKGMGADAIVGKATRKAEAWLYEEVTGNTVPEGEVGDMVIVDADTVESPLEKAPDKLPQAAQPQPAAQPAAGGDELPM